MSFNVDREVSTKANVDPFGRKWNIVSIRGSALYEARPEPFHSATKVPGEFEGRWTKPSLLQEQIKLYLKTAWDFAEKDQVKQERKEYAEKVETKEAKAEEKAKVTKEKTKKVG